MKTKSGKEIQSFSCDWKTNAGEAIEDCVKRINKLLKTNGQKLFIIDNPKTIGTDSYGYVFSLEKLDKIDIKELEPKED